jgi:hypothetical protein
MRSALAADNQAGAIRPGALLLTPRRADVPKRTSIMLTATLAISLAAAATASAQGPDQQEVGLLFTQTAPSGTLKPVEGAGPDRRTLVLEDVSGQVVWFTDRPARQSGHLPLSGFVSEWPGFGFTEDPPNAALSVLDAPSSKDTVILTLGQPRYRAKRNRLRYPARLEDEATGNLSHLESSRDRRVPRNFAEASLFVDDALAPVSGDCVAHPYAQCPGADLHGVDFHSANLFSANLSDANLSGALLFGAYLARANLSNANVSNANLFGADLSRTDLSGADLTGADLSRVKLSTTNLSGAVLVRANLYYADLTGADLSRTNISGARLCRTTMPNGSINDSGC